MDRRKFLQGAAALFAAPAIVKADNLMKIWVPPKPEFVTFRRPNPYYVTEFGRIDNVRLVETPERNIILADDLDLIYLDEPYAITIDAKGKSNEELYQAIQNHHRYAAPTDADTFKIV